MKQEDKNLLLKDLCARLPYGVKCYAYQYKIDGNHCECYGTLEGLRNGYFHLIDKVSVNGGKTYDSDYLDVRPYLRPMSSMTEEENREVREFGVSYDGAFHNDVYDVGISMEEAFIAISWFLERHFDINYLIQKGLALEAPEGMYKTE